MSSVGSASDKGSNDTKGTDHSQATGDAKGSSEDKGLSASDRHDVHTAVGGIGSDHVASEANGIMDGDDAFAKDSDPANPISSPQDAVDAAHPVPEAAPVQQALKLLGSDGKALPEDQQGGFADVKPEAPDAL